MGCTKGKSHRKYTVDEKICVVKMNTVDHISTVEISKITKISDKNIRRWVKLYTLYGKEGLVSHHSKKGNIFAALHSSKKLSKEELLELENLKLKIENERLKKGYIVKGGGVNKEFVSIFDVNMKLSKN